MKKKLVIGCSVFALIVISAFLALYWISHPSAEQRRAILASYGMHNAAVENRQSILASAEKYKLDTAGVVCVEPDSFRSLQKDFHNSLPEAMVFDHNGNYLEYKKSKSACNAGVFGFIRDLEKGAAYNATGKTKLTAELDRLRDLRGNALGGSYLDPAADYYVLISWATFVGKLNDDHVRAWQTLAANNKKAKIQVIEVNMDAQAWWPVAAQDSVLQMFGGIVS